MKTLLTTTSLGLALFTATVALAQPPLQSQPPVEMVLLPRSTAEAAAQWIVQPNAANAVQLYAALVACIGANPVQGSPGQDGGQCSAVTDALASRQKEITDLTAQINAAHTTVDGAHSPKARK
jgi:hypothetical protein